MLKGVRRFVTIFIMPPRDEDRRLLRVAALNHHLLLLLTLVLASFAALRVLIGSEILYVTANAGGAVMMLILLSLNRRGYVRQASFLMLTSIWLSLMLAALVNNGVNGPWYSAAIVIISMAGVLVGRALAYGFAVLSIIWGFILLLSKNPVESQEVSFWLLMAAFFISTSLVQTFVTRSLDGAHDAVTQTRSDLARTTDTLQRVELTLDQLNEQSRDMIVVMTDRGVLTRSNPALYRILGYTQESRIGRPFDDLVYLNDLPNYQAYLKAVCDGEATEPFDCRFLHKDGSTRWISWTAFTQSGHIHGIGRDMTHARKVTEQQIKLSMEQKAITMRQGFVSLVSHEFRTPLAVIDSVRDMLAAYDTKLTRDKRLSYLGQIGEQVHYMTSLVDDILLFNRMDSDRVAVNLETMDLIRFGSNVIHQLQSIDGDRHIYVYDAPTTVPLVRCDRELLRHILNNLLSNASKYSPDDTVIRLALMVDGSDIIWQVQDEGIGIAGDDHERLFEPFFRASNTGDVSGTGMGLAIVQQSVARFNGRITCTSELGKGTTFTVHLPLEQVTLKR